MLTVHFKTGQTLDISQEAANILRETLFDGAKRFQIFYDDLTKNVIHIIDVEEVVCISPKK